MKLLQSQNVKRTVAKSVRTTQVTDKEEVVEVIEDDGDKSK
jgi:hypothetical protein